MQPIIYVNEIDSHYLVTLKFKFLFLTWYWIYKSGAEEIPKKWDWYDFTRKKKRLIANLKKLEFLDNCVEKYLEKKCHPILSH